MTLCIYGSRFARAGEALALGSWLQVFQTQHSSDAHAWPYVLYSDGEVGRQTRIPKDLTGVEGLPLCHLIFLDYDQSNDHASILEQLQRVPEDHYLSRAAAIYPTKSGMRLVYRLSEPLTIEEFGPVVRGISLDLARLTDLKVDPTTDQWTRCFRLPLVTRSDGKADGPTWMQPYFFEPLLSEDMVSPEELPRCEHRLPWAKNPNAVSEAPKDKPSTAENLPTIRIRTYRKVLRAGRFNDYIFDGLEIPQGRRDQTLLAMAGEVVAKCYKGAPGSTAEEIYMLLVPAIEEWAEESDREKLWRLVQHSWNGEVRKENERVKKSEEELTHRDAITERMAKWLPPELIPNDPVERREFFSRHYCLQVPAGAFVITKTGEYSRGTLTASQLPAHFNDGLQFLVEGGFRNKQGGLIGGYEILNNYSTNIDDVEFMTGVKPGARLLCDGDRRILHVVPFALRQDLFDSAAIDPECEQWLNSFNDAAILRRWIAASLALHRGPVASCYLVGPRRVGKSLLSMALAECFHCQPIPAGQAFSEYNGALQTSPVITVDEGLPTRISGMDTADLFRSLVTGTPVSTQHKFKQQINSRIPYRIIFAANSFDMVKKLIGRRTLESQDRDAFRERILVIETGQGPADYLDRNGALAFTKDDPAGSWLGGECRLARHMMALYKQEFELKAFEPDGRLLVEGRQHRAFTLSFDLSGAGRDVVDDLTTDIEKVLTKKGNVELFKNVQIDGSVVWVRKRPYIKATCYRAPARAEAMSSALDRFLTGRTRLHPIDMTQQAEVDLEKLLFCAKAEGLSTQHLQLLMVHS